MVRSFGADGLVDRRRGSSLRFHVRDTLRGVGGKESSIGPSLPSRGGSEQVFRSGVMDFLMRDMVCAGMAKNWSRIFFFGE